MTSQTTVKTLLILGASGDLTGRLLLPGLARLVSRGRADGLTLVGAGSDAWTPGQWLERIEESFADANSQAEAYGRRELKRIRDTTAYHQLDVTADGQLAGLLARLEGPVAIYFAMGERATRLLDELKQWMGAHNSAIMAVMCLVIAAKLIGDGITGLA